MSDIPSPKLSAREDNGQDPNHARFEALAREVSLTRQLKQHQAAESGGNAVDLLAEAGYTLVHDGVQAPIRSVGQIADAGIKKTLGINSKVADVLTVMPAHEPAPYRSERWWAQQVGGGLGVALPFMATRGAMKGMGLSLIPKAESAAMASTRLFSASKGLMVADSAMIGFASDFFLRPVEAGEGNQLEARLKHGATGAAVMSTMTAGNLGLRQMTGSIARATVGESIAKRTAGTVYDIAIGAGSGAPAGYVSAEANARLFHGRAATAEEKERAIFTMTTMGGALSALHQLPRDKAGFELKSKELSSGLFKRAKQASEIDTTGDAGPTSAKAVVESANAKRGTDALADELQNSRVPAEYKREAQSRTQTLVEDQVAFLRSKSIEGLQPVEELKFDTPQKASISPTSPDLLVTSAKRYPNGVYVYENPNGMKEFEGATRATTDHETFIQTDFSSPHLITESIMTGGQITTKLMRRGHSDMYTNPNGLFGKGSATVLIADENAGINGDTKYSPVRLMPGEARNEASAARYEQSVKAVADKYNRTELDSEVAKVVERSGNTEAVKRVVDASKRGLDGRALVDFLGKAHAEATAWLNQQGIDTKFGATIYSPAADTSASPLGYVMRKTTTRGSFRVEPLPEKLPDGPVIIFGDVTKFTPAELRVLEQHKQPMVIIDPAFERGVNVIDLVKGTAEAKVKALADKPGDVIDRPARELAAKLNAKLINPKAEAPPLTEQGLKQYLEETYPKIEDRAIAAELFANGLDYVSMFDYARGVNRLSREIAARGDGNLASQKNVYFVQDRWKSSELMNYFIRQFSGVPGDRFVSHEQAKTLAQDPKNHVWLLDDALYTGDQMSSRAYSLGSNNSNRVSIAAISAYPMGLSAIEPFTAITQATRAPLRPELKPEFFELGPTEQQRALPRGGMIDGQMPSVAEVLAFKRFYHAHASNQRYGGFGSRTSFFYMSPDNSPFFVRDFLNRNLGTPRAFNLEDHLSRPFYEKPKPGN